MAAPPLLTDGATPSATTAPTTEPSKPPMKQEELDQVVAPIALYPDELLSQIFMASTYPLEIVQADRWVKKNPDLKGDPLAVELEKQPWDPSVKSLVNFPQVLDMMSDQLDWTVKLGDAFLAQQKQVMDTVQTLRAKAQKEGNLKSNEQQTVVVEPATATAPQVIVVQPSNPQVIYVPTYNPTVVYGVWAYPAYPPPYYPPPYYNPGAAIVGFGVGVAVGMAWGYAWGGCNWHGGNVNVNVNRNINVNNTRINHNSYRNQINGGGGRNGQGNWQHNPSHRDGVGYRDKATAQQYGRGSSDQAQRARDSYRGQSDAGRQNLGNDSARNGSVGNNSARTGANRPSQGQGAGRASPSQGARGGAFDDVGRGSTARTDSQRGQSSRQGAGGAGRSSGGAGRSGGGGGGGRGGGGGGRR
jgi:hypothetical protein